MAKDNITFYTGTQASFNALSKKDENGVYFVSPSTGEKIGQIYKGDVKYGASELGVASSTSLGGIKVSDDFDIAPDGTLSLYTPMSVSSFSNGAPTNEIGSSVTQTNFSWGLNKVPTTLKITSGTLSYDLPKNASGSSAISFSTPLKATTTFTLTATDARGKQATRTSTISFLHGKYHGIGTVTSASGVTDTFVRGLTRELASGRTGSFTVNAGSGQYIYFAIPHSWGTPQMYVGGFEGGFSLLRTFDFTNASGDKTSYDVYKSTNANLGQTTVEVR